MALAPQLSRAAYRRGYLQSLSRQAANEAYNLEANLRWLQDGDVEGEAQKAATIQAMARGAIDSKVIELVNYIVRQPDRGFVLSRIPLDQKRWLLINEEKFLAVLKENSRAIPVSGMEFLSVLAEVVRPIKQDDTANLLSSIAVEEGQRVANDNNTDDQNQAIIRETQKPYSATPFSNFIGADGKSKQMDPVTAATMTRSGILDESVSDQLTNFNTRAWSYHTDHRNKLYPVEATADQAKKWSLLNEVATNRGLLDSNENMENYMVKGKYYKKGKGKRKGEGEGKGFPKTYIRGAGMNPTPGAREPSHNWQQFGRYVLSRNDLENGSSVHIRYRNGQPVKNVGPKRVVGGSVGAIVRDIADGKAPQQRHMSQITEDERKYLSGLIKTCNIAIPNGVKTEKKTPKQKEHNEFEILKGQVLAGNDNPEIIKKFKNMLKKMVQSGQLNADDVRAIVDELP